MLIALHTALVRHCELHTQRICSGFVLSSLSTCNVHIIAVAPFQGFAKRQRYGFQDAQDGLVRIGGVVAPVSWVKIPRKCVRALC